MMKRLTSRGARASGIAALVAATLALAPVVANATENVAPSETTTVVQTGQTTNETTETATPTSTEPSEPTSTEPSEPTSTDTVEPTPSESDAAPSESDAAPSESDATPSESDAAEPDAAGRTASSPSTTPETCVAANSQYKNSQGYNPQWFSYTFNGSAGTATVTLTIPSAQPQKLCSAVTVGLASYDAAGPDWGSSIPQTLNDSKEGTLQTSGASVELKVAVPKCFKQIDLFFGDKIPAFKKKVADAEQEIYGNRKLSSAGATGTPKNSWYNGGTGCATVIINKKIAEPAAGSAPDATFNFAVASSSAEQAATASASQGKSGTVSVSTGSTSNSTTSVLVTEELTDAQRAAGWTATSLTCSIGESAGSGNEVSVKHGQTVNCTAVNTYAFPQSMFGLTSTCRPDTTHGSFLIRNGSPVQQNYSLVKYGANPAVNGESLFTGTLSKNSEASITVPWSSALDKWTLYIGGNTYEEIEIGNNPQCTITYKLTLAARVCGSWDDVQKNSNSSFLLQSFNQPGRSFDSDSRPIRPGFEDTKNSCAPLSGWTFALGTGHTGGTELNPSIVTGDFGQRPQTLGSTPLLDDQGTPVGTDQVAGAVTIDLTDTQADLAKRGNLWVQGGKPIQGNAYSSGGTGMQVNRDDFQINGGSAKYAFVTMRCVVDNVNGDNVEYVNYGKNGKIKHGFCYAYYTANPDTSTITITKKTQGVAENDQTAFGFTGSVLYGSPLSLKNGETSKEYVRASTAAADDKIWTIDESAPTADGWAFTKVDCTTTNKSSTFTYEGSLAIITLGKGDKVNCTYTNTYKAPPTVATPVEPVATDAVCTPDKPGEVTSGFITIPDTAGVQYKIGDVNADVGPNEKAPATYTVTAIAKDGYRLAEGTWSWTLEIKAAECSVLETVAVPAPTVTAPTCDVDGTLIIPTATGVAYTYKFQGGEGTPTSTGPGTYVITATPAEGYKFADEATTTWTLTVVPRLTGTQCTPPVVDVTTYTVNKQWIIDGDTKALNEFPTGYAATIRVNGTSTTPGSTTATNATSISVTEDGVSIPARDGYSCLTSTSGTGVFDLIAGTNKSVTVTNTVACVATVVEQPTLVVNKMWNIAGQEYANGTQSTDYSANLSVNGVPTVWGASTNVSAGQVITITESSVAPANCSVTPVVTGSTTMVAGVNKVTVTNSVSCTEPEIVVPPVTPPVPPVAPPIDGGTDENTGGNTGGGGTDGGGVVPVPEVYPVPAPNYNAGRLPQTGANGTGIAAGLGVTALLAGLVLLVVVRRRRDEVA